MNILAQILVPRISLYVLEFSGTFPQADGCSRDLTNRLKVGVRGWLGKETNRMRGFLHLWA
jgi:hypothetical protein